MKLAAIWCMKDICLAVFLVKGIRHEKKKQTSFYIAPCVQCLVLRLYIYDLLNHDENTLDKSCLT